MKSIPLVGTMILNGASDLLKHYESIDYPVDRYYVVDNSVGKCQEINTLLQELEANPSPFVGEVFIQRNASNAGFSGSVNQIIKQNTHVPYWCIFSVDWHVKPGELAKLSKRLEHAEIVPFDGILCDTTQNGYSAMVVTPSLVRKVGLLDENFFPAYYEDNDHRYRMKQAEIEWELFPLEYEHAVSSTINRDPVLHKKNQSTFTSNGKYYIEKWGGLPGNEKYETPFDMDLPLDYWLYDPIRIKKQQWT